MYNYDTYGIHDKNETKRYGSYESCNGECVTRT